MIDITGILLAKKAVEFYGKDHQVNICIEECSELIQALCHHRRKKCDLDQVCEEIADVYVALLSLRQIFPEHLIEDFIEKKSERLERRIQRGKKTLELI